MSKHDIRCAVCNQHIQLGKRFCSSCGAPHCPKCGAPRDVEDKFCSECGADLRVSDNSEHTQSYREQPVEDDALDHTVVVPASVIQKEFEQASHAKKPEAKEFVPSSSHDRLNAEKDKEDTTSNVNPLADDNVKPVLSPDEEFSYTQEINFSPASISDKYDPSGRKRGASIQHIPEAPKKSSRIKSALGCLASGFGILLLAILIAGVLTFFLSEDEDRQDLQNHIDALQKEQVEEVSTNNEEQPVEAHIVEPLDARKSYSELVNHYDKLDEFKQEISDEITEFNDGAAYGDLETRKEHLRSAVELQKEIKASQKELQDLNIDKNYSSSQKNLDKLYMYSIERLDPLIESYEIAIQVDDPSRHSKEIIQPFVDAFAPGTSRSESLQKFEKAYPKARPKSLEGLS